MNEYLTFTYFLKISMLSNNNMETIMFDEALKGCYENKKIVIFLPCGVYSGWGTVVTVLVRPSVRPYVHPYVCPNFFLRFLFFWDCHVCSS